LLKKTFERELLLAKIPHHSKDLKNKKSRYLTGHRIRKQVHLGRESFPDWLRKQRANFIRQDIDFYQLTFVSQSFPKVV